MAWTRSKLENHDFDHLSEGSAYTAAQGEKGAEHFAKQHSLMGQLDWQGRAGDAAWEHTGREQHTAYAVSDVLQMASKTSNMAAGDLMYMKGMVVNAILDAEADQFTVNNDLSIDDKMKNLPAVAQARQAQAQVHSEMIQYYLENFQGHLQTVAGALQAHHAALQDINYADGASTYGSNPIPHVSMGQSSSGAPQFQLGGSPIGGGTQMMSGGYKQDPIISNPKEPDKPNPIVGPAPKYGTPKTDEKSLGDQAFDGMADVTGGTLTTIVGVAGVVGGGVAEPETGGLSTIAIGGGLTAVAAGTKMVEDGLDKLLHLGNGDGK